MSKERLYSAMMLLNYFCIFDHFSWVLDLVCAPCVFLWINQDKTQELINVLLYLPFSKIAQTEDVRKKYWGGGGP